MINLQACFAQQKKIHVLPFELTSALPDALVWKLLVSKLLGLAELDPDLKNQVPAGFLACQLNFQLPGTWLESPLEWQGSNWVRIYWFQENNQALLGCELNIYEGPQQNHSPQTLVSGKWLLGLTPSQAQASRPFLKHQEIEWRKLISQEPVCPPDFAEIQDFSDTGLSPLEIQTLSEKIREALIAKDCVEPLKLAKDSKLDLRKVSDYLSLLIKKNYLSVNCYHGLEIDQNRAYQDVIRQNTDSARWQHQFQSKLLDFRVVLSLPNQTSDLLPPHSEMQGNFIIWPGETRSVEQKYLAYWQAPLKALQGRFRLSTNRPKSPPVLNLNDKNQAHTLHIFADDGLFLVKNTGSELQILQLLSQMPVQNSVREILSYQSLWPLILPFWPDGERFGNEQAILSMFAFSREGIVAPLKLWLEEQVFNKGGSILETGASAVLIMVPNVLCLLEIVAPLLVLERKAKLRHLWQDECLQIAATKGSCQLTRFGQSIRTLGPTLRHLNHILACSQGLDLILDQSLILQSDAQTWLAHNRWRVNEIREQNKPIFQVMPSRR